jgi:hypothetical protein
MPTVASFTPLKAPSFASANATPNIGGFFMQKNAIVLKINPTRDFGKDLAREAYVGAGSSVIVTEPNTGLTVTLVQTVDQTSGFAEWRMQCVMGGGVGDNRGGLCMVSP